jgi:coproporphyrinogen III oxidase-like Fe-S oxidoreductase
MFVFYSLIGAGSVAISFGGCSSLSSSVFHVKQYAAKSQQNALLPHRMFHMKQDDESFQDIIYSVMEKV